MHAELQTETNVFSSSWALPRAPEVGVIAFVPDRWTDLWQPRHQILSRLGKYFYTVWMDDVIDWRSVISSPHRHTRSRLCPQPGLIVYRPDLLFPRIHRPNGLAEYIWKARVRSSEKIIRRLGCHKLVAYLWRPRFETSLDVLKHDVSCYHLDDEYNFKDPSAPPSRQEARLLKRVDQVFVHSPGLLEKKGSYNPHTLWIPNGVDYERYSRAAPEPDDLRTISSPRIGYTGWLKKELDWSLIASLAEKHSDWSFVFVGPVKQGEVESDLEKLSALRNTHFLGAKATEELAAYPQHFDVCIMPYKVNAYTSFIYPLKLHEYLASGTPVVGSAIRSLETFAGTVSLAHSEESWSIEITNALNPKWNDSEKVGARQALARTHDWEFLTARIACAIAEHLGQEVKEKIETACTA